MKRALVHPWVQSQKGHEAWPADLKRDIYLYFPIIQFATKEEIQSFISDFNELLDEMENRGENCSPLSSYDSMERACGICERAVEAIEAWEKGKKP